MKAENSPHVRAPATWRSIVTADKVGQPQPVSCRSTSQVDDASQRLLSTTNRAILLASFAPLLLPVSPTSSRFLLEAGRDNSLSLSVRAPLFLFLFFHLRERFTRLGETWKEGRKEGKKVGRGCNSCPSGRVKKRSGSGNVGECRGNRLNVVPVLRPVTDCRLSDRLCPDQTRGMVVVVVVSSSREASTASAPGQKRGRACWAGTGLSPGSRP